MCLFTGNTSLKDGAADHCRRPSGHSIVHAGTGRFGQDGRSAAPFQDSSLPLSSLDSQCPAASPAAEGEHEAAPYYSEATMMATPTTMERLIHLQLLEFCCLDRLLV